MRSRLLLFGIAAVFTGVFVEDAFTQDGANQATTQPKENAAAAPESERRDAPMSLDNLSLNLGFEGSFDERAVRSRSAQGPRRTTRQINQATRLEETLGLESSGHIVGEDVLLFDVAADWGLSQEWYTETGAGPDRHDRTHGDLLNYDLSLTAFPRGKVTATGFAQKLDSRVPRMFLPSLDRSLNRYGGEVLLNDSQFPMRLSFEHLDEQLRSRTDSLYDDEDRGRDTLRYEGTWQPSRHQALRLEYEYADREEQYSGSDTRFDTRRNYLSLNHIYRFGDDERSSLETTLRWQDETGDLGRDNAELSTRLRLQHTDTVATNYALQYLRDRFQRLETETRRGEAGLTWKYDPSWTATVQGYGLEQRADGGTDTCEWGGLGNVSYAKDNSLGRFSTNLSYYHTEIEARSGERRGIVVAESVTLNDPLSSYLAQSDVDLATIVVTDAARTRTYLAGRDYVAIRVGRYAALRRNPLGMIANRETVLVSYTYNVRDDFLVRRDRVDWRIQQELKSGLTPYYAGSLQYEDLDRDRRLPFAGRDVNRHRVGATYRRDRWSTGLEYEYNDDSLDPYQAVHGNGDVVFYRNAWQQLDGKATVSRFWFDGTNDLLSHRTTLADVGLSYRYVLAAQLEATSSAMYRYEDDSLYGVTHGADLTAALEYRVGFFTLRFEAEYDLLHLPGSEDDGYAFWIKLKREIPVVNKTVQ